MKVNRIIIPIFSACAAASLVACVSNAPEISFNPAEVTSYALRGAGEIQGSAFYKARNGGIITCAGDTVFLVADSSFTREMDTEVRSTSPRDAILALRPMFDDPSLQNAFRRTVCDADGKFTFTGLAPGRWYVLTRILTKPNDIYTGRGEIFLRQFVNVTSSGVERPVLTNRDINYAYSGLP